MLHDQARDALLLVAHHERDLAFEVRVPDEIRGVLGGASDPEALVLEAAHRLHEVRHLRHGDMRDGAGRALVRGRLHVRAALVGDHDAARAHRFGAARHGAEVARVRDVVEDDHERAAVVLRGRRYGRVDHVADAHVGKRRGLRHDALVAAAVGLAVQHLARHHLHGGADALRLAQDVLDEAVALHVVGHENALNGHARAQRLDDGALALDEISHVPRSFASYPASILA